MWVDVGWMYSEHPPCVNYLIINNLILFWVDVGCFLHFSLFLSHALVFRLLKAFLFNKCKTHKYTAMKRRIIRQTTRNEVNIWQNEKFFVFLPSMKRITYFIVMLMLCCMASAQTPKLYHLKNHSGISMDVTDLGARIVSLMVPDRNGNIENVVCGFDTLQSYTMYKQNYGATVGRYIGRILGAQFSLDGKTYKLDAESNGHCSHGGRPGWANRMWSITQHTGNSITLQYISPDGESGFPGTLTMNVTYTLTDNNELSIEYKATTTKPTVLNPSNHSFFNISGDFTSTVLDQQLMIDGDSIALYDDKKCVTGELSSVKDTPFDFSIPTTIGARIDADNQQLKVTGGYDHSYLLRHGGDINNVAARIYDPKSGRMMEVLTTEPVLHIYSGNGLKANTPGKNGLKYARRTAICFETMHFADSPNKPQWQSTVLRPGETFTSQTIYRFSAPELNPKSGYVPIAEGGYMYYEEYGEGTPVILVHGHTLDRRMWRKQIEALSPYYRVITPDVRGYGKSSRLKENLHTTHVDDLITLMDSLHIEKAHIIGLSMGGFITADMVAMYPDRMLSCVMASGSLRNRKGPSQPVDAAERAETQAKIDEVLRKGIQQTRTEWIEQLISGGGSQAESIRTELTSIINDWDGWSLTHHEPHLWYANDAAPILKERCPDVPTLFLSGENEHKKRGSMMKSLPRSEFLVIPDCGHMTNMEKPEEFNRIIMEFLMRLKD